MHSPPADGVERFAGGPVLVRPATAELAEPPPVRGGLLLAYFAQPQFPADAAASSDADLPTYQPTSHPDSHLALQSGWAKEEGERDYKELGCVVSSDA